MPPRTVYNDPEQLWGDSSMTNRKRDEALKAVLVEGDINPFEALNLPTPSIEQEIALSKATIDKAYRSMMLEHHPDRYRLKIKKERGHSPDHEDLELSVIKMKRHIRPRGFIRSFRTQIPGHVWRIYFEALQWSLTTGVCPRGRQPNGKDQSG